MQIEQMVLGIYDTNCYIVIGERQECIVVDPADNGAWIASLLRERSVTPIAILLTHGHYDHFLAVPHLQEEWNGLGVWCHPFDCPAALTETDMGHRYPTATSFRDRHPLSDGDRLTLAGLSVEVLHTPGHTPGSVVFRIENALFSGDTLFRGSMGRTDFKGGDTAAMMRSLARLSTLPGTLCVLPGHGLLTDLAAEQRQNPYLKQARALARTAATNH